MIKKITKIKNYGIIHDFRWNSELPVFSQYNLIYGWNYTGKTIVSRIFQSFELKQSHENIKNAEFELEDEQGNKHNNNDLTTLSDIRVFNTDYIKRNLKWHIESEEIEPIFILGEKNIKLQKQLEEDKEKLDSLNKYLNEINTKINDKNSTLESAYTDKARVIKDSLQWPDYDKSKLKPKVESIKKDYQNYYLLVNDYKAQLNTYQSTTKKDKLIMSTLPLFEYQNISDKIKEISCRNIFAEIIYKLKENPRLNRWVEEGKELHKDETICQFCGNELPYNLLDRLEKHFSKDFDQLKVDITSLENEIDLHSNSFKAFLSDFRDKARLYEELQDEYEKLFNEIKEEINTYTTSLNKLASLLQDKKKKPFNTITFTERKVDKNKIINIKDKIETIINKHNKKTDDFEKSREKARKNLENHHASDFIKSVGYFDFIKDMEVLENKKQDINKEIIDAIKQVQNLEQKISETVKGEEKLNEILSFFFRDNRINIISNESNYKIYRNDEIAKDLSEGEKTAISFAHFLVRLKDKDTELQKAIVFIDDPVCSLDSNHIHYIYSIIKSRFGNKRCKQLFISTHNLEFLNLIKRFIKNELNKKNDQKLGDAPFYYMERRFNSIANHSTLIKLPMQLKRFNSEYSYLFSLLYEFKNNPSEDFKMLFLLPNITRRFLEAFLGFKKPASESWTKKLEILLPDESDINLVVKFVHEYSHNNTSERLLRFPDFSECKQIVLLVLDSLEKADEIHYKALCSNCI